MDTRHDASAPDDDSFVSALFDQALRQRETESTSTIDRHLQDTSPPALAELPPQSADSE